MAMRRDGGARTGWPRHWRWFNLLSSCPNRFVEGRALLKDTTGCETVRALHSKAIATAIADKGDEDEPRPRWRG